MVLQWLTLRRTRKYHVMAVEKAAPSQSDQNHLAGVTLKEKVVSLQSFLALLELVI